MRSVIFHFKLKIITNNIDGSYPINVSADLRLICDAGVLDIKAHGGSAVFLHFSSLRKAFAILRIFKGRDNFADY